MTKVAGIGVGLFILTFIWVLALILCLSLSKARGAIANLGGASVVIAILLTIILWFIPREDIYNNESNIIYDYHALGRNILLSFFGLFLLIGLMLLLIFHGFEPQRAESLKKIAM